MTPQNASPPTPGDLGSSLGLETRSVVVEPEYLPASQILIDDLECSKEHVQSAVDDAVNILSKQV